MSKKTREQILAEHDKAIQDARAAGDKAEVTRLVDELPTLGAWHRRDQ